MALIYPITDYPVSPPDLGDHSTGFEHEHRWEVRRYVIATGAETFCPECQICFSRNPQQRYGRAKAKAKFGLTDEQLDALPDVNLAAQDRWCERRSQAYAMQRLEKRQAWFQWYGGYMASPEWYARRLAVFRRDGNKCRGCGADAEQVHHLTYERVGREDLADLVSVCERCHRFLHRSPA